MANLRSRGGLTRWLPGAVVLAWVVPVGAHAAGLDVVLPLVVIAGLMMVQRGATGLLDRLVLALVQLFGALCAAGLVLTVWPWHLHPVPIAGVALTVLVLVAEATGRLKLVSVRARLGRCMRPVDRLLAAAVLAVAVVAVEPFALRDLGGRLGIPLAGEDIARHFLLYDVIGRTGGYVFLRPQVLRPFVPDELVSGVAHYPQGVHLAYAVLDRFIRSATTNADAITSINLMVWLLVGTYLLFALAVLWSLRRLAGPGAGMVRLLPVLLVAAAWLAFADPIGVLSRGFPNELVGLGLNAVLTAVAARPLWCRGEQTLTGAALIVGVAFSYPLFLPYTIIAAARWAWRARLWRFWWAWASVLVLVPLTALSALAAMGGSSGQQLLLPGTARTVDRPATVVLLGLAVTALVARRGLRSPARRTALVAVTAASAFAGAVAAYQIAMLGHPVYYFDKLLHLLIVVALVALGGLTRLLPAGRMGAAFPRRLAPGVATVFPLVLAAVLLGGAWHTSVASPGLRLVTGVDKGVPDGARDAILMTRAYPDGSTSINVDLMGTPWRNCDATLLGSAMQGSYRYGQDWYLFLSPAARPKTFADLDALVAATPVTVRFFVSNPDASMLVVDSDHPQRRLPAAGTPYPAAFGDPASPTNLEAARLLAAKYPGKVQVVHAKPPNP